MRHRLMHKCHFAILRHGVVRVAINPIARVKNESECLIELEKRLRGLIPFEYETVFGPEIVVLGEKRAKGIPSVEFTISHGLSDRQVILELEKNSFVNYMIGV